MQSLADISRNIAATADGWAQLSVSKGWAHDAEIERAKLRRALLYVAVAVLSSDGPINAYEGLLLKELFGADDYLSKAEAQAAMGANLLARKLPILMKAIHGFASDIASYRPDRDPVITVLNQILDAGLAADKLPSETEAWAASRVMTKLRQAALMSPEEIAACDPPPQPKKPAAPKVPIKPPTAPARASERSADFSPVPVSPWVWKPGIAKPDKATVAQTRHSDSDDIQTLLSELNNLVGLHRVKEEVETLVNLAKVIAMRAERGLPSPAMSYHLVFSGNPGTGKTTVARILGRIYGALGLLTVGKCLEVDRAALVGQYVGQTTTKTAEVLSSSLGSVLFIDEAYSLTAGESNLYGEEAVSVILKSMEDHRDNFVLIVAGYTQQMEEFLDSNPGLRSRFSRTIEFPDYNADELVQIFGRMCASDGYVLDGDAAPQLRTVLTALVEKKGANFANAREARKVYERAVGRHANRIAGWTCSDEELCLLTAEDILTTTV